MSAIDIYFNELRAQGRKALIPFITAGDPDLDFTTAVLQQLVDCGCPLCEVGIPYSDPIADGPVIQESYTRALRHRIKLADTLATIGRWTGGELRPLVTMISSAIVYRHGMETFVAQAKAAGVAGAIVPDLPLDEADQLAEIARAADFSLIQLVTPTTPRERARRIAALSTGFLYYVSVTGITGERSELPTDLVENVAWLRGQTELPICVGFGISRPEQIRQLAPVADGLIVGSALVRRIALASQTSRDAVLRDVSQYIGTLLAALEE